MSGVIANTGVSPVYEPVGKLMEESKNCTYCSPVNEEGVEVHEHPSGLFGVGLLVEVSIEVAQL